MALTRRRLLKAAAFAAASGLVPARVRAQVLAEVRVAGPPLASNIGVYLAEELGFFKDKGIRMKYDTAVSAAELMAFLAAGRLDVGLGGVGASTFNAILRGMDLKYVANKGIYLPGIPNSATFLVRKDLYEKGVRTIKDLKGKKFAINLPASVTHFHMSKGLEKNGLSESDVEMVTMSFPDMVKAFQTKAIDAGEEVEPFVSASVAQGLAVSIADFGELFPYQEYAGVLFAGSFITGKRELAFGFIEAYVRGLHKYYELTPYHDTVVSTLEKYTRQKKEVLKKIIPPWIEINGAVNVESLNEQQEWFVKRGFVKEKADLAKLVDQRFLKAAWDKLGKKENPGKEYWEKMKGS